MILRPVRETMGITSGVSNLPSLFWGTLAVTLVTQPIFGWLTSRFRRTVFLPWVYGFFALNLLGFYLWFHFESDHTWIAGRSSSGSPYSRCSCRRCSGA